MKNDKISYSIDWTTLTFDFIQFDDAKAPYGSILRTRYEEGRKKLNRLYELLTYPSYDERTEEKKRFKDYDYRVTLGEFISLFLNGCKNGKGLNHSKIEIPGNGCRDFINRGGNWFELYKFCIGENGKLNGIKPTRIDAAIDIRTNEYFDFDTLIKYLVVEGSWSSSARDITYMSSYRKLKDKLYLRGNTIYLGSMSSEIYLCIYDKNLERIQAGDESAMLDECWYRIEMRFRDTQAEWFMTEFLKTETRQDYSFICDALFKVLDIKTLDSSCKTLRDRPTVKWWLDFLNDATKAKFNPKQTNPITLKTKEKYVEVNAGMALTQLMYCFNNPLDSFYYIYNDIFDIKTDEIDNKRLIQINEFREEKGLKPFKSLDDLLDYNDKMKYFIEEIRNYYGKR